MTETNTQITKPQGAALYVHWPFCKKKCPYCDFNSHVREAVDHQAWCTALLREMGYWHARAPEHKLQSIFLGGGTPSLMPTDTVHAILSEAQRLWGFLPNIEITLEANPTSVEAEKFRSFRDAGVNRVSLGVQSLRPEALAFLGREHSAAEALNAVELAACTFARYSFDLIYALPQQTLQQWELELREAMVYARGHLSLYQLTIEENTAFYHAYHVRRAFALPQEQLAADLYQLTNDIMRDAGLPAYEISNYAVAGQESLHNLAYWRGDAYFGIGPGAHGRVGISDCQSASDVRLATCTLKSPERWIEQVQHYGHGVDEETPLTIQESAEEKLLMGMRLVQEGARFERFHSAERAYLMQLWEDGRVQHLQQLGLLKMTDDTLVATAAGQLVLNSVIQALLA